MSDGFQKHDDGKPPLHLVPVDALLGAARIFAYGAGKYAAHNWRKPCEWNRLYDAVMRHLLAWQSGEDIDPESGLPHVDHALCSLMMLSSITKTGAGEDDRWRGGGNDNG